MEKKKRVYTDTLGIQELSLKTVAFIESELKKKGIESAYHRMMVLQHALAIVQVQDISNCVRKALIQEFDEDE